MAATAEHPIAALVRRAGEAFEQSDLATLAEIYADSVVWHFPGRSQLAGDHQGLEAVLALFGKVVEMTGGSFRLETLDVMVSDNHAVEWQRATAERDGKAPLNIKEAIVFRSSGGRIVEVWQRTEEDAVDAFFA